ncbi:aminotransferase class V-fold PLP-dependent enzyme [Rhodobacteraceae bacterium KMM 6894]|nr:aminotransferase class V-fold PLP-dependent enzyme [Rhodobacteraceae bacterium KMM 6894]
MDDISLWRADFDIPDDVSHLNAAFMTPPPRRVLQAGRDGVDTKASPWTLSRATFYDDVEKARAAAARLINASPDDIAITGSTSYGIAVAAKNLTVASGTTILSIAGEHPSQTYAWTVLAQEVGATVEHINRAETQSWADALTDRIKDSTRPPVSVLALTQVHWSDGSVVDLVAMGAVARAHGIALVVDATQSAGVMDLDVQAIQPDFIAFATYKWMLGPYALAFLYASPKRQDGQPIEQHAFSRAGADGYSNHYDRSMDFMPGARRYDMGERANFVTLPMAITALDYLNDIGTSVVREHIAAITTEMANHAASCGVTVIPAEQRSPHLLGLSGSEGFSDGLVDSLRSENIFVSARDGIVRVAPHIYSGGRDAKRFAAGLEDYLSRSKRLA